MRKLLGKKLVGLTIGLMCTALTASAVASSDDAGMSASEQYQADLASNQDKVSDNSILIRYCAQADESITKEWRCQQWEIASPVGDSEATYNSELDREIYYMSTKSPVKMITGYSIDKDEDGFLIDENGFVVDEPIPLFEEFTIGTSVHVYLNAGDPIPMLSFSKSVMTGKQEIELADHENVYYYLPSMRDLELESHLPLPGNDSYTISEDSSGNEFYIYVGVGRNVTF